MVSDTDLKKEMNNTDENTDDIHNGMIWYTALMPAIGLFVEKYALNKWIGIMLWAIIIITRPIICAVDLRRMQKKDSMYKIEKKYVFFPIIYLYKSVKMKKEKLNIVIIGVIALVAAFLINGFTKGIFYNEETILNIVKTANISNIEELDDENSVMNISESAEQTLSDTEFTVSSDGYDYYVKLTGYLNESKEKITVEFYVCFDGYALKEFKVDNIYCNDEIVEDEEREDLIRDIFVIEDKSE